MSENWGECYYDHYTKYLGDPINREIFGQAGSPTIQILSYEGVFPGCRVFCSLGLTHYASILKKAGEVCVSVDDGWQDTPYLLANSLFYMVQSPISLGWGIGIAGIPNIRPDFANTFGKTALYLTTPFGFPAEFEAVNCRGESGSVYLGVFISAPEYAYFRANGAEEFEALLEASKVDPFNLRRHSCI